MEEKGYTTVEICVIIVILGTIVLFGGLLYIGWHFLLKWW